MNDEELQAYKNAIEFISFKGLNEEFKRFIKASEQLRKWGEIKWPF